MPLWRGREKDLESTAHDVEVCSVAGFAPAEQVSRFGTSRVFNFKFNLLVVILRINCQRVTMQCGPRKMDRDEMSHVLHSGLYFW